MSREIIFPRPPISAKTYRTETRIEDIDSFESDIHRLCTELDNKQSVSEEWVNEKVKEFDAPFTEFRTTMATKKGEVPEEEWQIWKRTLLHAQRLNDGLRTLQDSFRLMDWIEEHRTTSGTTLKCRIKQDPHGEWTQYRVLAKKVENVIRKLSTQELDEAIARYRSGDCHACKCWKDENALHGDEFLRSGDDKA